MRHLQWMSFSAALAALFCGAAFAQGTYPSKPVTMVVTAAPGGPNDIEARLYGAKMQGYLGQPFVLDYKAGAGTTIGTGYVAKAAPDGYTLLVMSGNFTVIPALYKDLPFDTLKDFAPLSQMSLRTTILLVSPAFPAKNLAEYVTYAKANPGKINYAHTGAGSGVHLAGAWLHNATNTTVTYVSYKGTAPLLLDLIAGRVDSNAAVLSAALPQIRSGKIRALAIMSNARSKTLPELPTIIEQGIPGFNYSNWFGFIAPGATPATIVSRLAEGFARTAKEPDVIAALEADGSVAVGNTPAQFRQIIIAETATWRKVVQDNGIKLEE